MEPQLWQEIYIYIYTQVCFCLLVYVYICMHICCFGGWFPRSLNGVWFETGCNYKVPGTRYCVITPYFIIPRKMLSHIVLLDSKHHCYLCCLRTASRNSLEGVAEITPSPWVADALRLTIHTLCVKAKCATGAHRAHLYIKSLILSDFHILKRPTICKFDCSNNAIPQITISKLFEQPKISRRPNRESGPPKGRACRF